MATVDSIAAGLKVIESKKENLRKAFEDLQSHSHHLSSFTLKWPELDSYFTSQQTSILHKFTLLQTQIPTPVLPLFDTMKSFCQKMDALGLRNFLGSRFEDVSLIIPQLVDTLKFATDAPAMVLDAMDGFYPHSENVNSVRKGCLILLEALFVLKLPDIKSGVKEKAMKIATEWRGKMDGEIKNSAKNFGFLLLVAIYGLLDGFQMDDVLEHIVVICRRKQAFDIIRALNIVDHIPDLIEKLISKVNRKVALKFLFELEMTEKFPPVSFLNAYLEEAKEAAEQIRKSGKPLNEVTAKEMNALKLVMRWIDVYKLESLYPKNSLMERIMELEEEKGNRKRAAALEKNKKCAGQQQVLVAASSDNAIAATHLVSPSAGPGPFGWQGAPLPFPMLSGLYVLPPHQYHPQ